MDIFYWINNIAIILEIIGFVLILVAVRHKPRQEVGSRRAHVISKIL
jgi:uncharacterized membrane protein